jgi:hypothetical protein
MIIVWLVEDVCLLEQDGMGPEDSERLSKEKEQAYQLCLSSLPGSVSADHLLDHSYSHETIVPSPFSRCVSIGS